MLEAERKHIARQGSYNRVPHPLVEGLVYVGLVAPPSNDRCGLAQKAYVEWRETQKQHLDNLSFENEVAKVIDAN